MSLDTYDDAAVARIEATERDAFVPVGTWRTADAVAWRVAVQLGLRRRTALRERMARLAREEREAS